MEMDSLSRESTDFKAVIAYSNAYRRENYAPSRLCEQQRICKMTGMRTCRGSQSEQQFCNEWLCCRRKGSFTNNWERICEDFGEEAWPTLVERDQQQEERTSHRLLRYKCAIDRRFWYFGRCGCHQAIWACSANIFRPWSLVACLCTFHGDLPGP